MQRKIHFQFLRNPIYILGCYVLLLLPEFVNLCSHNNVISPFWGNIPVCSKEFVFTTFLENSIWSMMLLIFVFEIYRGSSAILRIDKLPVGRKEYIRFQANLLLVAGVSCVAYILLTYFFAWHKNSLDEVNVWTIIYRTIFVTYLGINGVLLLSFMSYRRDPLSKELEVKGPLGKIPLTLKEITFFEKIGRNYVVNSNEKEFKIELNLTTLENLLCKKHFARINRSVIVNISAIKSYSYWENEKYILSLNTGKEFVVTRKRIVELKRVLS
ncbi:LytTR family DNA-binding domain-containing protein [Aquimarina sediminis]|uniref:LytTR family DNA-binding domain-containing protein n=1 Tax=Aquimarina sediminis TaxID=2070536 RepID=UPI000CA0562D|nr:LytTR family DNA-binding domain-containing protein [Aquimarina sediminis]